MLYRTKKCKEPVKITVKCKCEKEGIFTASIPLLKNGDVQGRRLCTTNRRAATILENSADMPADGKKQMSEIRKKSLEIAQEQNDEKRFQMLRDEIKERTGHVLTSCHFGGTTPTKCEYTCGLCGADKQSSYLSHMKTNRCGICRNWPEYDEVCTDFRDNKNFTMEMTRSEFYDAYKVKIYRRSAHITVRCKCTHGLVFTSALNNLKSETTQGCSACNNDRRAATMLENHGVVHALQNPELLDKATKSGYALKPLVLSSGRLAHLQGYERDALLQLLGGLYICGWDPTFVFTEDNILLGKRAVGRFTYTLHDQSHYYFPDFKIVDTNIYIEVKSTHTIFSKLAVNLAKFKAVCDSGSRIVVMVLDGNKNNVHFAELDNTNIDEYVSKLTKMRELCTQKMTSTRSVNNFKRLYDSV